MNVIRVWRDKPGKTVATYARPGSRTPLATMSEAQAELLAMPVISAEDLRTLVAGREPFAPVHVTTTDAEEVLGWKAETQ